MLKLRRDLSRAVTILEMIKKREKSKRELLHLTLEIVEKRYDSKIHMLFFCFLLCVQMNGCRVSITLNIYSLVASESDLNFTVSLLNLVQLLNLHEKGIC